MEQSERKGGRWEEEEEEKGRGGREDNFTKELRNPITKFSKPWKGEKSQKEP